MAKAKRSKRQPKPLSAKELARQYQETAASERAAGGSCHVNRSLPEVSVVCSNGDEYYYQEWQADELIQEQEAVMHETGIDDFLSLEDFILASSVNW